MIAKDKDGVYLVATREQFAEVIVELAEQAIRDTKETRRQRYVREIARRTNKWRGYV